MFQVAEGDERCGCPATQLCQEVLHQPMHQGHCGKLIPQLFEYRKARESNGVQPEILISVSSALFPGHLSFGSRPHSQGLVSLAIERKTN